MDGNIIEQYTWNILKKQLQKYQVSNTILYEIIDNVKLQLNSIIYHWNDFDFRNAILILGSEEGSFYELHNEEIANMVVVAIRNSLIEGIASEDYKKYGNNQILEDFKIKEITSTAIKYFEKLNISEYSKKINLEYDFYREISNKYPVALNALKELAKCSEKNRGHKYIQIKYDKPYELIELDNNFDTKDNIKIKNIESGISPYFNSSLCEFLRGIKEGKSKFFLTDSFKMLTRNFEKIMRVLEFILTHDASFATCNYLVTPDYVSRRKELLRAGHRSEDFFNKLDKIKDISEDVDVLKNINC